LCLIQPRAVEGPCPQDLPGLAPNAFCSPDDSLRCFPAQRLLLQELFQYPRLAGGRCLPHLHGNRVSTSTLRGVGPGLFSLSGQLGAAAICAGWRRNSQPKGWALAHVSVSMKSCLGGQGMDNWETGRQTI